MNEIFLIVRITLSFLLPYMLLQRKESFYGKKTKEKMQQETR